jgi:uncharacterized protein HemX
MSEGRHLTPLAIVGIVMVLAATLFVGLLLLLGVWGGVAYLVFSSQRTAETEKARLEAESKKRMEDARLEAEEEKRQLEDQLRQKMEDLEDLEAAAERPPEPEIENARRDTEMPEAESEPGDPSSDPLRGM